MIAACKESGSGCLGGRDAFTLYDTYGFPLDITVDVVRLNTRGAG